MFTALAHRPFGCVGSAPHASRSKPEIGRMPSLGLSTPPGPRSVESWTKAASKLHVAVPQIAMVAVGQTCVFFVTSVVCGQRLHRTLPVP